MLIPADAELSNGACFYNTLVFNALMILIIIPAFVEKTTPQKVANYIVISLTIFVAVGAPFGACTNQGMFFSGMIFAACAGWDGALLAAHGHYWWVVAVAPMLGVVIGVVIFRAYTVMCKAPPSEWRNEIFAACGRKPLRFRPPSLMYD